MKLPTPARSHPPPRKLGRYEVRAKIAEGGMAIVFVGRLIPGAAAQPSAAWSSASAQWREVVALKMIRDEFSLNRDFVNMFLDEAKIVSRLRHPNIVQLHELGVEGTRIFIAMELLFGQSLWHVWDACKERGVRLRYDLIAWIGARVAEGLHHAHDSRDTVTGQHLELVHRDVNATNIFLTYDGEVKIIDFGLAKAQNRVSKTAAGIIKGKVAYMSPEQAIGSPVDRRTDIFALGTTLWELSVDRRLFKHTDEIETLKKVHAADVPDPCTLVDGYPPELWRILKRALAREKEKRYPTAAELARDLDAFARSEGRSVAAPAVAEVVRELFKEERERQARWIADASAADRPAPAETLKPPSGFYAAHHAVDSPRIAPDAPVPTDLSPFWKGDAAVNFAPAPRPPSQRGPALAASEPAGNAPAARPTSATRQEHAPPRRTMVLIVVIVVALFAAVALFVVVKLAR